MMQVNKTIKSCIILFYLHYNGSNKKKIDNTFVGLFQGPSYTYAFVVHAVSWGKIQKCAMPVELQRKGTENEMSSFEMQIEK